MKTLIILVGSASFATISYLLYIKRRYRYLKSIGYDGPKPTFFIGNLAEFATKDNSIQIDQSKPIINHYSKTLQRWTKQYGKIYGYFEGHSPVIVLADPDLVSEVFLNQNKLLSYRRSFPMSKHSSDPTADIFVSNGMKWMRVRIGLEKVMLNNKNLVRCLEYADKRFIHTFVKQNDLSKPQANFNIQNRVKLFMVQTMFNVIFGIDLESFITAMPFEKKKTPNIGLKNANSTSGLNNLYHTQIVANRFGKAFAEYEAFSLLKFLAMTVHELAFVWRSVERFKRFFNTNVFRVSLLADPMDWFFENFIQKHMLLYSDETNTEKVTNTKQVDSSNKLSNRGFGYLNSFLYLTYNSIFKNPQYETVRRQSYRQRYASHRTPNEQPSKFNKTRKYSVAQNDMVKHAVSNLSERKKSQTSYLSIYSLVKDDLKENEMEEFESWTLTVNEALNNSLLMFFAGYETTSSAIGFCCHVMTHLPEQREKLLAEINDYWTELRYNLESYTKHSSRQRDENSDSEGMGNDTSFDDDVFEDSSNEAQKASNKQKNGQDYNHEKWNELYSTIDSMKYLDMFVKEVLRMFPIANSMVSRKCMVDDLYIDNGNYYIPKNMNIVVDVLSLHYDPVIWGPISPEVFHPERFLSERNPAAYLPFGIGARKCLGMKMALSQIKLFIVRLLQNYTINLASNKNKSVSSGCPNSIKLSETIETKDVFFCGPVNNIEVSISKRKQTTILKAENIYSLNE